MARQLKAGDIAKIDLACHIDGFIASAAHTIIVGGEKALSRPLVNFPYISHLYRP